MPASRARSRAFTAGLLLATAPTSIPSCPWTWSRIAWRLVPEPLTRTATGKLDANDRKLLQGVLPVRGLRALERVVAGEAGVAVRVAAGADRLVHAFERQVGERIRAHDLGDVFDRAPVGDHLLAGGHVDAVVAWVADRRRGH